mmetsp:Transcript_13928/g.35934  ORF Transcript_13928/g.35934 Transcript_13928/m.35934 type:complete len:249 (-) Transcript_13928:2790-3536(-)
MARVQIDHSYQPDEQHQRDDRCRHWPKTPGGQINQLLGLLALELWDRDSGCHDTGTRLHHKAFQGQVLHDSIVQSRNAIDGDVFIVRYPHQREFRVEGQHPSEVSETCIVDHVVIHVKRRDRAVETEVLHQDHAGLFAKLIASKVDINQRVGAVDSERPDQRVAITIVDTLPCAHDIRQLLQVLEATKIRDPLHGFKHVVVGRNLDLGLSQLLQRHVCTWPCDELKRQSSFRTLCEGGWCGRSIAQAG